MNILQLQIPSVAFQSYALAAVSGGTNVSNVLNTLALVSQETEAASDAQACRRMQPCATYNLGQSAVLKASSFYPNPFIML